MFDPEFCRGISVGQRHELPGNKAVVSRGIQDINDGFEVEMTGSGIPPIRIRHVEVEDAVDDGPDALFDLGLFDVHVEGIEQKTEVIRADPFDEIQALGR